MPTLCPSAVTLYHGDCLVEMKKLADNSIDTVITDPPYGLSKEPDIAEVLTHWLNGDDYEHGSKREGRQHCIANVLDRAVIGDSSNVNAMLNEECIAFRVHPPRFCVCPATIKFNDEISVRKEKVNNKSTSGPLENVLVKKTYTQICQALHNGQFVLRKRKGFAGCVEVCTCFTEIRPSLYSINVGLCNDTFADTEAASDIMAFATAEVSMMLTLDLTRGTGELSATYRTDQSNASIELVSTQSVRASTRTGSLASPLEAHNISEIDSSTDGACTFDLFAHVDFLERLTNPIVPYFGFMSKSWDSFVPGPNVWREAYRVMKPGGTLLCFAGTRTADLMSIALRFAGFEIRDQIMWLYGSG